MNEHENPLARGVGKEPEVMEELVEDLVEDMEEVLEDLVDIEIYAQSGKKPPHGKRYRIRIDREYYEVTVPKMTGREILTLAGKVPPDKWMLTQKLHGGSVKTIGLDEVVDFRAPGIERFMTLPLDQTEG